MPAEFKEVVADWKRTARVHTEPVDGAVYSFVLIFVKTEAEVKAAAKKYIPLLEPDAVSWMAYPKKSSKKYKAEITRDSGWSALGELGFEGVSLVSIDDDWSAFRFRKVDFIKTMKRRETMVMSEAGKAKTQKVKSKK
ncbi:MAG TPA: hypothetical protein VK166_03630 [Chitinophagaceae bacterium]|nr:hypothetical protein [Chitinophagaceae bacterium]